MKNNHSTLTRGFFASCLTAIIGIGAASAEQVIFTEIQYNAKAGEPDFIEVTNNTATPFDIGLWSFSDGVDYTFPDFNDADTDAHILKDFETILVSHVDEATLRAAYPGIPAETRIFGPYIGALSNSGETLTLSNKNGVVMTTVDYNDGGKWPAAADGTGHTLTRINPNLTNGEWRNWRASEEPGGTPGVPTTGATSRELVISEVHFDMDGAADWIEIHNPGPDAVATGGFILSASRKLEEPASLSGSIPAGGYVSFELDFTPDENGDLDLFLAENGTVVDAIRLDRENDEETFQSFPVGVEFYGGQGHTRDAANNPASRETAIVINEIMYDAPSDQGTGEFVELYNRGGETVDLSGWKISDGVRFDFPDGTTLAPGAYLVIAADAECLREAHGNIPVIGNWTRGLSDRGELLRIEDANGNLVDEVDYLPEGDWPLLADGDGSSMELRHPDMNNDIGTAWADSDESEKTSLETFTYTHEFERSKWLPLSSGQELHAHLVGDSHVVLENISVKKDGVGSNLLRNPGVMSPTSASSAGWVSQGTHWASFFDGGKFNLIADGHGDNKANRAEVDFATSPTFGESYTLSFDGRWVSGKSRIIFQTLDHGFGTSFLLPIPDDLGTPGAANSALLASAAPTVSGVIHSPAVPDPNEDVTVTARVQSALPVVSVELVHRISTTTDTNSWSRVPMTDDGTGLFSATVDDNDSQGNITQFYVEAKTASSTTFQPRLGADRPAMWIVDGRTMPSQLLRERFIVSNYSRRALTTSVGGGATFDYNFPRMSNHFFNATFIANESEIYYNAEIRKSGSPFTRSTNANIDHGKWKLPGDRLFRGRRRSVIDASGTPQGSNTPRFYDDRIARYFLYQLGHPTNEMEFVHSVINGDAFKVRENHEPISNDFLNRNFEDGTKGTLLRIDDEWRFTNDNGDTRSSRNADWSYKDTDNPIAYHSEWLLRTRESDYDYGNFIEFTRLLDEGRTEEPIMDRVANADMLALNAAVRGYDADWDTITVDRGKNAYFYRPKEGDGWMLLHWDGDRVFERTGQAIIGNRVGVRTYFNRPFVRRQVNYYLTKLLDEHTKGSARTSAWMQAERTATLGSGVVMPISHYTNWFNSRENLARNYVTSTVNNTNFVISTPNTATSDDSISLAGTSPPTVFKIRVAGQSGTTFTWIDRTNWELSGIVLKEGVNVIEIEGIDHDGRIIEQEQFTITKTDNASPVIVLETSPKSRNLAVDEEITISAAESYDPDGDDLVYHWQVTPASDATLTIEADTPELLTATFSQPGFYLITSTVSDGNANSSTKMIGVSVHSEGKFSTFGDVKLEDFWTRVNAEKHDNSFDVPYYSLQDHEGRLTLNIPGSQIPVGLPEQELPPAVNYIDFGSTWKYDDTNQELTGVFAQPDYDDSAWQSGPGFLGFNQSGLPDPGLQTSDLTFDRINNLVTYYFRNEFEFEGDPIGARLSISHLVDDGVRYYLNGQVLGSVRLPEGPIDSKTGAERLREEDEIEENILVLDVSSAIRTGVNVFAAEVHNSSSGSSDLFFGAKVDIAANPLNTEPPNLDEAIHPWVRRALPAESNWILQTEVKMEKVQFGDYYAGLLVEADQDGNSFRYGVGFDDGDTLASIRVNPSGTSETLASVPFVEKDIAVIRLERVGDILNSYWVDDGELILIQQVTLPAGTTFSSGGVFASTETDQSLEASFDYAMLIETAASTDFDAWLAANGFVDPDAEYENTGLSNLLAYALGRDLNANVSPVIVHQGGTIGFSHRQRIAGGQISYRVEKSTDMLTWTPAGDLSPSGDAEQNPDGTFTVNLLSDIPTSDREETYYRLVVGLR